MYKNFVKRILDIILSLIALPFVLLVVIVFAPIIHFTDKGPAFYNAERIGKNGKPFKMYKLRSMYVNAPDIRLSDGSTYNAEDDPRVTPIGRFLRKTKIRFKKYKLWRNRTKSKQYESNSNKYK